VECLRGWSVPSARIAESSSGETLVCLTLMSVIAQANDSQGVDNFYAYSPSHFGKAGLFLGL